MRLLLAMIFAVLASTNLLGQDNPLDKLTVTTTRLKCSSGFAVVTYGYRRGVSKAAQTRLEFVVIETGKHIHFQTVFALSSKVDDVTPPAYLGIAGTENTVDLPNKNQVHALSGGRYRQSDSDVTLAEVRAWLDQPDLLATTDSLLDFKTKRRTERQKHVE
ncbi:MAG: hypothetical protein ABJZ55_05690 [Fuerstiella sp.]